MEEYKKYLADQILSEEKIVTYRSLSRALKTHVNTAKGMLYEFHRSQNAARPGTIHATYLIYGTQKVAKVQEDGDVEMTSSPPEVEPLSEEVATNSLTFVPGDRLKEVLATYEEVSSFHIYSLARHPTREPQMLADVSQQIREQTGDDSISMMETYGSITNPNVRRRDRKGKPPVATAAAPAAKPVKKEPESVASKPAAETKAAEDVKKETGKKEAKPPAKESPFSTAASKKGSAPPALKKSGSSGIMGSFAKAAAKAASKPKEAPKKKVEPVNDSPALSDDGEDDDDIPAAKPSTDGRRSRKEREADLKRMMEEESDEEPEEKENEPEDEPMEEAPEPEPETQTKKEPEPSEVVASSGDGRRRGKRKVMKKKQIMDEQGYLVTTQEAVWEEFSEDEAPPKPAAKPKPSTAPSSGSQSKSKKAAPRGQGNIMSFFSKK